MKNRKMKMLSFLFVFLSLFAIFQVTPVFATTTGTDVNGFTWTSDDGVTYSITGYQGSDTNITIPRIIDGHTVTSIESNAFNGNNDTKYKSLASVTIPDTVTSIGGFAFYYCSSLVSISIPDSVTSIGDSAFAYCISLPNITLPANLSGIGNSTFQDCKVFTGITIPDSVKSIGNYAFFECISLTDVTIPIGVTSIGEGAFKDCKALRTAAMPDSVTSVGNYLFYNCQLLSSVRLSNNLTHLGDFIFYNCFSLAGATLPSKLADIGNSAFENCTALTNITIPNGVTKIGHRAFIMCGDLANITIPNTVRIIDFNAFAHCYAFTNIVIPDGVTSIGDYAFYYCTSLIEVTVPRSVTDIGFLTFNSCNSSFKLKGFGGSYAQIYAGSNSIPFQELPEISYTVTFNSQGGSAVTSKAANYNTTITAPAAPTKTGYGFGGWYKDAGCTNAWDFASDKVTGDITLYAKWNINSYHVTFNSQGGTAVASKVANYNTTITAPAAPTQTGYSLGGWYKDAGCTNAWNFGSDKVTGDITLYAKWNINSYHVTFNSQGGSAVTSKVANYNTTVTAPAAPTKTGYSLGGWYKDAGCTNIWNFGSDKVTGDITLYAKWNINSYTVTFNSQGGSAVTSKAANYNTTITAPAAPTKTSYRFGGWYKDAGYTTAWNFASNVITANITLYAKWILSAPSVPTSVKAVSASYNSINISWRAVSGASGYEILRASSSAGTYGLIKTLTGTSYTNTEVTTNSTYYYKVRAYRVVGSTKAFSGYTAAISAKPVPSTPVLKAARASSTSIKTSWNTVSGATGYEVYRATSKTGTYSFVARTTSISYTNTKLRKGQIYYYKVRAYRLVRNTKVYGNFSTIVSAKPY